MKTFITALILTTCLQFLHAQNTETDSLKSLLLRETKDTVRVKLLAQLSYSYRNSKPDTALQLARQAVFLSRKVGFRKGEGFSLNMEGLVYTILGNYPKALETLFESLKIEEELNNLPPLSATLNNIGLVYYHQGDYRQSIAYYYKSKAISEEIKNDYMTLLNALNLGDSYEKLNQLDSARIYTHQAYELAIKQNNIDFIGTSSNNMGNIFSKMGQTPLAIGFYHASLPYYQQADDKDGLCEATLGLAKIYQKTGNRDSSFYYAKQSLAIAQEGDFTKRILDASNFLTEYYMRQRNIDSAFVYQQLTVAANDSLFSKEKVKQMQSLTLEEKLRQQEIAEAEEIAKEKRMRNLQLLGVGAFIPAFFGGLLFLSKRKVKQSTVNFLAVLGLLLFFEFITFLIHPLVAAVTHETPVLMLIILVGIASVLIPVHHKTEEWIKEKLGQKPSAMPQHATLSNQSLGDREQIMKNKQ